MMRRLLQCLAILLCAAWGAWLCAQWQVNPQIGPVNNQLYGGGTSGSVKYARGSQSRPMQSELRYMYRMSGALPSDIRMGKAKLGPLHPSGPQAYIPAKPEYIQSAKPGPSPKPQGSSAYSTGSIKYSSPSYSSSPSQVRSNSTGARSVSTPSFSNNVTPSSMSGGSVRYKKY